MKFRLKEISKSIYANKIKSNLKNAFAKSSYVFLRSDMQKYMILCQLVHFLDNMPVTDTSFALALS